MKNKYLVYRNIFIYLDVTKTAIFPTKKHNLYM